MLYERLLGLKKVSLRFLGGNRATEVRFGRFLSNRRVQVEELIEQSTERTGGLVRGLHVLAIQDTTELNYQSHSRRVRGLGTVGNGTDIGLFLHPLLVVEAESGACLGLGAVHSWLRQKTKASNYRDLPIEEKESYRWLSTAEQGKRVLREARSITIIADRESDIYEEWYRIPDEHTHVLTRACRERRLSNGAWLSAYVSTLEVSGITAFEVRERTKKRSAHLAKLAVRYGAIEIKRPVHCSDKQAPKSLRLRVVDVRELEETVIAGEEPIHWCLLTTHEIDSYEDALRIVGWYRQRWNIEQLFRTLKTEGFDMESSELETGEALTKLAVIALRAAVQTMQLTLAREGNTVRPMSDVFTQEEEQVLKAVLPRLEGKTVKQHNPYPEGRLSWAAWIIARLGGWKGYASERPPGPITMLRGQIELAAITRGWALAKDVCIP